MIVGAISLNGIPGCIIWLIPNKEVNTVAMERHGQMNHFQSSFGVQVKGDNSGVTIEKGDDSKSDIDCVSNFPVLPNNAKTITLTVQLNDKMRWENSRSSNETVTLLQSMRTIIRNRVYMLYVLGVAMIFPSLLLSVVFLVDVLMDRGLPRDRATFGILIMNAFNIFGRMLPGIMMQCHRLPPLFSQIIASVASSVSLIGIVIAPSQWLSLFFCGLNGISFGMVFAAISLIPVKLIGTTHLPNGMGLLFTLSGFANILFGPLSGETYFLNIIIIHGQQYGF